MIDVGNRQYDGGGSTVKRINNPLFIRDVALYFIRDSMVYRKVYIKP